jgi:formate--tetrahydrofolate ligase
MTDIEIARRAKPYPITEIAKKLAIPEDKLELYGKYKAKLDIEPGFPKGRLVLVTAINPTPFGEGKTTISVGLSDSLSRIGEKVCLALREPSLGPVFGVKGGATGGGYAQVIPMEDINLHFTGDFHAITAANNLLSALIDNHIKQGNELHLDINRIEWRRCMDMNDRALREIDCALGGDINGTPRRDGFVITAASEIMAILCLSENLSDLKRRLGNIVVGYDMDGAPVRAKNLKAADAMAILLKDAIKPNLVQTLEATPAIIHGGPFANIAHGCNSVRATKLAMSLADIVVTEAGFGAELGAEKFIDIKCRKSNLKPSAVVLVATARALKYNGGCPKEAINKENLSALANGFVNLAGHLDNLRNKFGIPAVVAINRFTTDSDAEIEYIRTEVEKLGSKAFVAECWGKGGGGCIELAQEIARICKSGEPQTPRFTYALNASFEEKIEAVAKKIYGAGNIIYTPEAKEKLAALNGSEFSAFPICIAKTQYSFSADPAALGRPQGFDFVVRDISLRAGSEFVVVVCGSILLMPGLPKEPAAVKMTIDSEGVIEGLF